MEISEESICCQDQKEVPEEYFEYNGTLSDKTQQIEEIERTYCNVAQCQRNVITTTQRCNNVMSSHRFLKMGDKTGTLKRNMQFLKIETKCFKIYVKRSFLIKSSCFIKN